MSGCGCDGAKCRLAAGDERHGTTTGYAGHKCRCAQCRAGWKEYRARNRAEKSPQGNRAYRCVLCRDQFWVMHGEQVPRLKLCSKCLPVAGETAAPSLELGDRPSRCVLCQSPFWDLHGELVPRLLCHACLSVGREGLPAAPQAEEDGAALDLAERDNPGSRPSFECSWCGDLFPVHENVGAAPGPPLCGETCKVDRKKRMWSAQARRRRGWKRGQQCSCDTPESWDAVWALDDKRCAYCGALGTDVDHIIPLRRGGWGCINNYRVACDRCNSVKGARPLAYLLARLEAEGTPIRPGATNSGLPCPAAAERMSRRMLTSSPTSFD